MLLMSDLASVEIKQFYTFLIEYRLRYAKGTIENAIFKQIANSLIGKFGSEEEWLKGFRNDRLYIEIVQRTRNTIQELNKQAVG